MVWMRCTCRQAKIHHHVFYGLFSNALISEGVGFWHECASTLLAIWPPTHVKRGTWCVVLKEKCQVSILNAAGCIMSCSEWVQDNE